MLWGGPVLAGNPCGEGECPGAQTEGREIAWPREAGAPSRPSSCPRLRSACCSGLAWPSLVLGLFLLWDLRDAWNTLLDQKRTALEEAKLLLPAVERVQEPGAQAVRQLIDQTCGAMQESTSPGRHVAVLLGDRTLQARVHKRASPAMLAAISRQGAGGPQTGQRPHPGPDALPAHPGAGRSGGRVRQDGRGGGGLLRCAAAGGGGGSAMHGGRGRPRRAGRHERQDAQGVLAGRDRTRRRAGPCGTGRALTDLLCRRPPASGGPPGRP